MNGPHLTPPQAYRWDSPNHPIARIVRVATALGAALVFGLCVMMAIRGLRGAFAGPSSAPLLVLAAAACECLASLFRVAWRRMDPHATRRQDLLTRVVAPSIAVICIGVALSVAATSRWAAGCLWLVLAGGEVWWWYFEALRGWERDVPWAPSRIEGLTTLAAQSAIVPDVEQDEACDESVIQQLTRSRNDAGIEVIAGLLRAEFEAGERYHSLHVAFCPPLPYEPAVVVHQLDGSPLNIKVAQSEVFGARVELRRDTAAELAEQVTIWLDVQPREPTNLARVTS